MNVTRCHHSNNGTPSNAQLLVGISIVEEFCSRIMPPKKKKGKSNINKKNKKANEGGIELEEKYRRSALDVTVLRDHLALRGDVAQQAQSISHDLRSRMRDMEQELHHERLDRKDVNAAQCQEELRAERKAHEQLQQEKDTTIADLQNKLDNMETNYEKILHDTLDSLTSQLAEARLRWEQESTVVHQEYKELLSDFGLNSLDI
ncbi:coiled-coil domain-containing protein 153 isoform X2 [Oncorhynchus mykiss]|uniref:coiled-coil domain-containing protein 153 isoform X2 n=1 Tax=Oncorhynchus mykiss TaxID=8022 RepID=UPI0018777DA4|nr:coiled-coil domain-containing protein 153 isoform X2 [Oncorhynchus mykiss]